MTSQPAVARPKSDEWETPSGLFDALDAEFGPFSFDAAASLGQHSANLILGRGGTICVAPGGQAGLSSQVLRDGLHARWSGRVWLNPPFSMCGEFVKLAHEAVTHAGVELVLGLVPAKPGVRWWQSHVLRAVRIAPDLSYEGGTIPVVKADMDAAEVRFLKGRVKFTGPCYYNAERGTGCDGTGRVMYLDSGLDPVLLVPTQCGRCKGTGKITAPATFDSAVVVWRA